MHEVEKLCSRVAIIHKGRAPGRRASPHELLERFDQPDLEELFFYLVERADPEPRTRPETDAASARAAPTRPIGPGHARSLDADDESDTCAGRTCS